MNRNRLPAAGADEERARRAAPAGATRGRGRQAGHAERPARAGEGVAAWHRVCLDGETVIHVLMCDGCDFSFIKIFRVWCVRLIQSRLR